MSSGVGSEALTSGGKIGIELVDGFDPEVWKLEVRARFSDDGDTLDEDVAVIAFAAHG